jgi:16S rRNA (cytosine967-C5)-methyltransferase
VRILAQAARRDQSVEDLLAAGLRRHPDLSRPERALLLELVQGVKRWEIRLDWVLGQLAARPLKKVHPLALVILRVAAYQLLFLDRIPARAALHEAVAQARAHRLPEAQAGFINALLRTLAREGPPGLPPPEADPVAALSLAHAHPSWLVRRWLERWGFQETEARLTADNRLPPLTIRVNTLKTSPEQLLLRLAAEGVHAVCGSWSPTALTILSWETPPQAVPSHGEGLWLFQDEAAMLAGELLPLRPGMRLLEIGAGRGGKTTHLAERLENRGLVAAMESNRMRLHQLKETLGRWGAAVAHPVLADATRPLPLAPAAFDAVVIDAPCSGLGVIRRHPEIKTRRREADLATFPPRQRAMLEAAAPALRPGGRLLYLTCTTEPEENEVLVQAFLRDHPEFRLHADPEALPTAVRAFFDPPGWFRTSPAAHNLDAFFAALLLKE